MRDLAERLAGISVHAGAEDLAEARRIIAKLRNMNLRWNVPELSTFIKERQRELFLRR
ncbi:MAG: hypothetical protein RDU20_14050 [Desulfomonilaceae bacterium]|nr:hypothetical protein [Desulfomonilaceae bacterium]